MADDEVEHEFHDDGVYDDEAEEVVLLYEKTEYLMDGIQLEVANERQS